MRTTSATTLLVVQLKAKGLPRPQFEYQFHPSRKWKFDICFPAQSVAVEVEGGFFGVGKPCPTCGRRKVAGHTSITRLFSDAEKYNAAAELGWRVLRYPPKAIVDGLAIRQLERILGREPDSPAKAESDG